MENLNKKFTTGIFWRGIQSLGQRGIVFVIALIMARLLTPEDFGLFAIIYFFIAVSEIFIEGGLGIALVQKKDVDEKDLNTVLFFNLLISILMAVMLFFAAPFISVFYNQEAATNLLRVLGLKIIIDSLATVQYAQLRRKLRFRTMALSNIVSILVGGSVGVTLALHGNGVWSLIWQQLITAVVLVACYWIAEPWMPKFGIYPERFGSLFKFGGRVLLNQAIMKIFNNIYTLIIGKAYSAELLGYYNRAYSLVEMPVNAGCTIAGEGTAPVLYRLQDDDDKLRKSIDNLLQFSTFLLLPILVGMAVVAKPLINVLLGQQWLPAVPYFQILCFTGIFRMQNYFTLTLFKVKGEVSLMVKVETVKRVILVASAALTFYFGIIPLLLGAWCSYFIGFFINSHYCHRLLDYGLGKQFLSHWKIVVANILMGAAVYSLYMFIQNTPVLVQLVILSATGGILYFSLAFALKIKVFAQLRQVAWGYLNRIFFKTHKQ